MDIPNKDMHSSAQEGQELSMSDALIKHLREVVEANLSNEQFSVEDLASEVALSRSHLHRKLRKISGQSISQFIREIRLEHAFELLKKDVATVGEISFRVGFGSSTYFIKCFSEAYGYSPGEVKKKVEEGFYDKVAQEREEIANTPAKSQKPSPLELLHPASSEGVIREVFEAMIEFKPSLEKFLLVDEDEGETVDIRLLAYQIFKNYPWPIGIEIRRLFSVGLKNPDIQRLRQLNKTIHTCLRILSYIGISELVNHVEKTGEKAQLDNFSDILSNTDPVNCIKIINQLKQHCELHNCKYFTEELKEVFDEVFLLELSDWLSFDLSEEKEKEAIADHCSTLEETAITTLKKSAFLVKYKLVNVGSIIVRKSKFKPAKFEHQLHLLNSSDAEFQIHQEIFDQFADSNAVLLMKSLKEPDQFLNLSPFMIDTHNEDLKSKDLTQIKKDIYLYSGVIKDNLNYVGTEVMDENDLTQLSNYEDLLEEFQHIKILLGK